MKFLKFLPETQRDSKPLEAAARLERTYSGYAGSARKRRNWAASNRGNIAIRAELFAHALTLAEPQLNGNGKILDIGCGGGWFLNELNRHAVEPHRLHGVDLIKVRIDVAKRRLPGADIRLADARDLPHLDDEFEVVTLLTCLSSMPDPASIERALVESCRVLAPNGLLLCYEPRISNPLNRATQRVPLVVLKRVFGTRSASHRLTGFPPLARRLGPLTAFLYPFLTRAAPTHLLSAWTNSSAD